SLRAFSVDVLPPALDIHTLSLHAALPISFLKTSSAPGTHLFQPGGLESPLATSFGVLGLPNLFLVGKDGKVISRTIQVNGLEDRSEEHTSELQSLTNLVCRLLLYQNTILT